MLIISSKQKLTEKFGENFLNIDKKLNEFASKFNGEIFYIEDNKIPNNPNSIRKFINSKDPNAENSVLIVGGDDIIPFWRLKNPASDDGDEMVYSDNPYASTDENFLIPERSIGRIPDANDANFLISVLENFINFKKNRRNSKFGYTADEWIEASKYVYKTINNNTRNLKISPPTTSKNIDIKFINKKKFYYFNLHGSEETKYWYG
ncbi:MAG: hypothetical protein ACK4YO_00635, partial [Candidatus Altarchaeaceae archaeon]